jgi:hypothetical protein
MLDIEKMKQLTHELAVVAVSKHFGADGSRALAELISIVTKLYRNIEPELLKAPLPIFVVPIGAGDVSEIVGPAKCTLAPDLITHELDSGCILGLAQGGEISVFDAAGIDRAALSKHAIVYVYDSDKEYFLVDGQPYRVANPSGQASAYAKPTYSSLTAALQRYAKRKVANTSCYILEGCWADDKRLFTKPGPESTMRRSLEQYLRDVFPDAEVRPEQVVDESHPVDIKVTWGDTLKRALIEIKWLGKSRTSDNKITVNYTESRARDGAKQLADYMDADAKAAPGVRSVGYLVVIDARRRKLADSTTSLPAADAYYYRDRDIRYDPDYAAQRKDFHAPIRMFAEPLSP